MTNLDVKRLDHVSYTVSDLDRSVAFYAQFGYEPVNRYAASGPELDVAVATENADMDIQVMRRPDGGMLELISYVRQPSERAARNSVVGAAHLAFVVGDIQAAYEELTAEGVEFLSEPNTDRYGERWVYFRDPDGITVELMQPNADSRRAVSQG
jgi:catechol 2,3-dioxygenase-like lactoylglutathione lyase family enzyme